MLNRLELSIKPNNQITLTYGSYRHVREIYKDIPTIEAGYGAKERNRLARVIAREKRKREPKYDWRGFPLVKAVKSPPRPLAIIKKSQRKPKSCKLNKPKSFTSVSGQRLRECGAAIDHVSSHPSKTVAITLTLPCDHEDGFRAIAAYSGYAINRLFQPIRRSYGADVLWFYVWEYQKRGALHCHIALYHPESGKALAIGRQFRYQWFQILQDISALAQTDMFLGRGGKRNDSPDKNHFYCEPAKRSLGAYFSKYAGKSESKNNWYCQKYPVSRFWGSSSALKALVRSLSLSYVLEIDDTEHIEYLVGEIIAKLSSYDINLQSQYDFDIGKTYQSGERLCFARGSRTTFYCHPTKYKQILGDFAAIDKTF